MLFSIDNLIKTEEIKNEDLFLFFLPDFVMNTPIHFMLENDYYESFNSIVKKLELLIKTDDFIEKITKMFIYILENVKTYPITALKRNYCYLSYDGNVLSSYDKDDDNDDEKSKEIKKASLTRENINKIEGFFEKIANKIKDKLEKHKKINEFK